VSRAESAIDGAGVEVIRSYLVAAAEEMRATLVRTAFNPVIYEVLDFGISIYDSGLDLIGEASGLTFFLGANDYAIRKGVEYVGAENLEPGDVVIMNYPYWNGAHSYDATLFAPVFEDNPSGDAPERAFAYLVVRAHWMDLGAKDPGYVLDSTDMHQEGLIFPGTKVIAAGVANREILEIIRFNSRMPDLVMGDFNAQVASLRTGERRIKELLAKFGRSTLDAAIEAIQAHGERTSLRALAALPKGSWTAVDWMDDDGVGDEPIEMRATVTITDESFTVDFEGSHGTARGPVNMPLGSTIAMCKVAFKALTSPDEPANAGQMRPLVVKAEPGNLFHAVYPAPTFTLWTGIVALELIFKALGQGMPERLAASSGGDLPGFMMVGNHPDTQRLFAISNGDVVGWGATREHDGSDLTIHFSEGVARITPIEVMEARTTMFFDRVEAVTDSGGAGRHRGGVGLRRDISFLGEGELVTVAKKTKFRPWALEGGLEPEANSLIAYPDTEREWHVSTKRVPLAIGDTFRVVTAGGGGHGPPAERDPAAVLEDVRDGFVSREAARDVYGVDIDVLERDA
jgi:N-methylhydantoinase B